MLLALAALPAIGSAFEPQAGAVGLATPLPKVQDLPDSAIGPFERGYTIGVGQNV